LTTAVGLGTATLAAVASASAATASTASGKTSYPIVHIAGPRYTTTGGATVLNSTQTVPHWHGSFVDGLNGQTYGFNMVGADPSTSASSTVNTEILPLTINFAADGGAGFSGNQAASNVSQSPIFQPTALPSGETTQYLNAVMRSEFNKIGSNYNVLLNNTGTMPTQTMTVPADHGGLFQLQDGTVIGLVDAKWFSSQLQGILMSSNIDPTTLPIVISNNVYLYIGTPNNCCVIGFHGAGHPTGKGTGSVHGNGDQQVLSFAWATWIPSANIFGPGIGLTDVAALSHEISEWGHDPFTDNFVNNWEVAGEPQYGCSNVLETGDPLVGVDFAAGTTNPDPVTGPAWHLQDSAYLWWFERQATQASNGAYSYLGTFTTPASTC
jgi:hypothetical protein